jgi:putative NADH-flavin reductase
MEVQAVRLFLLGATGNSGRRILSFALHRGHELTVLIRDRAKLLRLIDGAAAPNLNVLVGDIDNSTEMKSGMCGHDVVINAAGHVAQGPAFNRLVQNVVDSASEALGEGGRLWQFGGAAILDVPGTDIMAVDLPMVPKIYEAHRTNLMSLQKSFLDRSMLCPGPMIEAADGKPTDGLRLSVDQWPVERPVYTYVLPRTILAFAFKQKIPELTVTYEDAATVVLDNLDKSGRLSRRRVGLALPPGLRNCKSDVPD